MAAQHTMTRGELVAERVRLERRLHAGWDAIDEAEAAVRVADADRYFNVWHGVLKEYEATCDAIRAKEGR